MESVRLEMDARGASGDNLEFFFVTGSTAPPIVTLADNNGFPFVRDIYARGSNHDGKDGVHVTVRFESRASGNGLGINLSQPGMQGDITAIPLA
ncbi:hypothetical protein ACVNS2_16560 [Paenibacillus caseinilyticus]|uniref:hypothetical protein n=1 Tax=Paenibacillus mucilaginosus TaxID=61624 RepID=UPI000FFE81F9|nr:hypothetical protein [Paenibacillus mucilaginosus]